MEHITQIIHLDMDAFYASVEVLDNPALKGKPVIVGGIGPRGVVSTASYEARAFGVHSALPIVTALRLCPQGVFVPPRMARYQEISRKIMDIFGRYTPLVEPLSLDEAFLEVTGSIKLFGPARQIAQEIKAAVKGEIGLTVTAGIATQKHLAKIASGMHKPDGLTEVPPGRELEFLWPLPLNQLWGVGRVTLKKLSELGLSTIGELAALDEAFMAKKFGESGRHLWQLANGLDARTVEPDMEAKSIGAEETYAQDLTSPAEIKKEILALSIRVSRRLRRAGLAGRTITLKLRNHDFKTITRAKTQPDMMDLREEIYAAALALYEKEAPGLGPLRLIGVTISQLATAKAEAPAQTQLSLFDEPENAAPPKRHNLNLALDKIADKFGDFKIKPATLADKSKK